MKTITIEFITLLLLVIVFTIPGSAEQPPKMKMTTDIPASITTPDTVETSIGKMEFFDGIPTQDTVNNVYEYMDLARAVQVYVDTVPIVSMQSLRIGGDTVGSKNANQFLIAQDMLDSRPLLF